MRRPTGSPIVLIVLVATLTLSPVLYVLSIGPAWALANNRVIGTNTVRAIYQPVLDVAFDPNLGPWLEWYLDLWSPKRNRNES